MGRRERGEIHIQSHRLGLEKDGLPQRFHGFVCIMRIFVGCGSEFQCCGIRRRLQQRTERGNRVLRLMRHQLHRDQHQPLVSISRVQSEGVLKDIFRAIELPHLHEACSVCVQGGNARGEERCGFLKVNYGRSAVALLILENRQHGIAL